MGTVVCRNVLTLKSGRWFSNTVSKFAALIVTVITISYCYCYSVTPVGLKMNLLDRSLSIDLRYLGVRLPIPPPGSSVEAAPQELPPAPGERPDPTISVRFFRSCCCSQLVFAAVVCRCLWSVCVPNRKNNRCDSDQRLEREVFSLRAFVHCSSTQTWRCFSSYFDLMKLLSLS